MTPEEENAALRAENAALRAQVQGQLAEVQALQGQLAKDSHNRSTSPSSDGLARKKSKSLRTPSGKKAGGQPGHAGHQVRLVETPAEVVGHRPVQCAGCQAPLGEDAPGWGERRQVHELPLVRLRVVEQQVLQVRCPRCGVTTQAPAPAQVRAPRQYGPRLRAVATYLATYLVQQQCVPYARSRDLLAAVFGAALSEGTLGTLVRQGAQRLREVEDLIKAQLRRAAVLHHDETGVRVVGPTGAGGQWTHVTCTKDFIPISSRSL
jgi:transposase